MAMAGMGIGAGLHMAGTFMGANAAKKRKSEMYDLANTPGLDFGALTQSALGGYESVFDRASALSGKLSQVNQAQLNAQEETALPGIAALRQKALGRIGGLFDEDSAWLRGVQRRGAALGLSSGLMGSGAGQMQTLRLSDQESMQRTQLGSSLLGSLISGMRIANSPGTQAFLGPTISEQVNQRAAERAQRMQLMGAAIGLPGSKEYIANNMQQVGGMLMGGGMMGMMGGGMGGSGGMGTNQAAYNYAESRW